MSPQNSALGMYDLGSVTIADFLVNESGINQSLTLQRGKPLPNEHILRDGTPVGVSLTSLKPRRPSLNLSGTLHLEQKVGRGRFGYVYNARLDKDGDLSSKDIPPLVVKICIPKKYYKTEREAYYYEEMETLQGSVISRYYGHFMAVVEPGNSVKVWTREKRRIQESDDEIDYSEVSYKSDDEDHIDYPRVVTILLLERYTVPKLTRELIKTLRKEARRMYREIAAVGIEQNDVHPGNVVQANETYLPTLPSPKNKRMFQWRIIDFGIAQKSERPYADIMDSYAEFLEDWIQFGNNHCDLVGSSTIQDRTHDEVSELAGGMYDLGSVTIVDFLVDESEINQSLTLKRGKPAPNQHSLWDMERINVLLTSNLKKPRPSNPNLSGTLHLEQKVGGGKFGYVYNAHLEKDGDLSSKDIPPLVVKICTPRKYYKTEREAYNYEEMETLQGSVIPRYYGHFMAVVEPGKSVKVWTIEKRRRQELDHEIPQSGVYESDDEDHINYPRVVTILLLERYTPNPLQLPPELVHTIREDAMLMFAEIAAVGIQHNDIHLNNVVQANETYLPTLSSPKYNKKFQWRIIDFGLAQKSEHIYKELMFLYEEKLEEPRWNP